MADIPEKARKAAAADNEAMPGGRFPIRNVTDLHNAIRAVGRAKGGEPGRAGVRRFIIRRAVILGQSHAIPASWNTDGSLKP